MHRNGERWLLSTHHLLDLSGSEVVILELVEELMSRGIKVSLHGNVVDDEFVKSMVPETVDLIDEGSPIRFEDFYVIYCQHNSISRVLREQNLDFLKSTERPVFIYNHLSPYEQFEAPGPFFEELFADVILANSPETMASLRDYGERFAGAILFQNPAPSSFERKDVKRSDDMQRILCVSNHPPGELESALELLQAEGYKITRIGRKTGQKRLCLADFNSHDAVITIGKSVQYAFRARLPVYCYDHFGGPGWLSKQNMSAAEEKNFSGRCHPVKRTADEIAADIKDNFHIAHQFLAVPRRFCLEDQIDYLMDVIAEKKVTREAIRTSNEMLRDMLIREWVLFSLVDKLYRGMTSARASNRILRDGLRKEKAKRVQVEDELRSCKRSWFSKLIRR